MDLLKEIDLGSSLLSIAIAAGFIAIIILIIRTLLIGINYVLSKSKQPANTSLGSGSKKDKNTSIL